jgi:hypothetical protein
LIDNELRVSMDVKLLKPKFGYDAWTVDQCLVLHDIVVTPTFCIIKFGQGRSALGCMLEIEPKEKIFSI